MLRRVGISCGVAVGLLAVTGCTVPPGGVVGVTVDAQGKPVIVIQMCEGHIDGATLYRDDPDPDRVPPQDEIMGKYEASQPVTGFSQFDLDSGGNGWAVVGDLVGRDPQVRYTIYGWTKDNSWSAEHVYFSDRELTGIESGTVLVPELEKEGNRSVSLSDFKGKTCADWP